MPSYVVHASACTPRVPLLILCALLSALGAFSSLPAQQPPAEPAPARTGKKDFSALGYLRFVNATGHEGSLRVTLDGEDINPQGYADGIATGSVGFPPKNCQIELRHDTLGKVNLPVTLKPGEVASVIALALPAATPEGSRNDTEPPKLELSAHVISSPGYIRGNAVSVTVLQATLAEKLDLTIGNVPLACVKLEPAAVGIAPSMGEVVPVSLGDKKLLSLSFVDRSDRVLILFTNQQGVLKNITLDNEVF